MGTELVKTEAAVSVWSDATAIRKQFAPTLTEQEFNFFMRLGSGLGANPFTREIWAVKYKKDQAAAIFLGRDFYRRKAQEQSDYDGHTCDAVYSGDNFTVRTGEVEHEWQLKDRGKLVGAYCSVYRKSISKPFYVFAELREYDKGFSQWKSSPATMIKKVAEAQALRGAFQGVFAGTYDESEQWEMPASETKQATGKPATQQSQPEPRPVVDAEIVPDSDDKPKREIKLVTPGQVKILRKQLECKGKGPELIYENFGIADLSELAAACINDALALIAKQQGDE